MGDALIFPLFGNMEYRKIEERYLNDLLNLWNEILFIVKILTMKLP